jgi:hypothetical protein
MPSEVFQQTTVVYVWRNPLDRLVSYFFSPHRFVKSPTPTGRLGRANFRRTIRRVHPVSGFLQLEGPPFPHQVIGLRFDKLESAVVELEAYLKLVNRISLPHRNKSVAGRKKALKRANLYFWWLLWRSRHWEDFRYRPRRSLEIMNLF